ncbi:MBL fold metallo-hydrolase [Thioclava sp. FR2]|uniref:MBL fold metallo-hydrolase n=1 Tax=Thioclava sp. FR2 TaxID=3445780 RepID=UPI003EC06E06
MRLTLLPALMLAWPVMAQERIPSHCHAIAQGPERLFRAGLGDALEQDHVRIHYIDHSSFVIETPGGVTAVTDYNGYTGRKDWVPDVVTMNNAHITHWSAYPDPRIPNVLEGWAGAAGPIQHELDLGEMLVRNVHTDVRSRSGAVRENGNSVFVFEAGGLCIGHLGHLHHPPDDAQYASIGRLDVILVPVDGGYTMATEEMAEVVKRFRSSIVIPMHWFSGSSLEVFLADIDGAFDVVRPGISELVVSLGDLPRRPTIMVLEPDEID